jgi:ribosomal protein L29
MNKQLKEIKDKSIKELENETRILREEIAREKLEAKVNPPKDVNALFKKKKKLAVVLTVISQKKEYENADR